MGEQERAMRLGLLFPDGRVTGYAAIRAKEMAVARVVMQFPALEPTAKTFSLTVHDQPLISGLDLREAAYEPF